MMCFIYFILLYLQGEKLNTSEQQQQQQQTTEETPTKSAAA
jgi:hypothetical protein